ncbi:MAG: catechol 2,3-dioxygenase-like lactoylglutathione lyase family enzyme [Hyphomicrobiaceae bacterium]|jgi:catechol 2,3-dioxygenase-like lactoylglutathione lyase family enzyme
MSNPAFKFDHVHIIAPDPHTTAKWYVDMLGAIIKADTIARGAPQIFVELGGTNILIRGQRPGEAPVTSRPIEPFNDFSSHNEWGSEHFGFMYDGDLKTFCDDLATKGVEFPVALKQGVHGKWLCYISAPDNVSIELMQV